MLPAVQTLLSKGIYLGTSSWKYPGWQGWFYTRAYRSQKDFNENCLEEYAEHFPAVGVDHTYYAWPTQKMFEKYVSQTPGHFRFALKATERATVLKFPSMPRYGKDAGKANPEFLDAAIFKEKFLRPLDSVAHRLAPIMIEFSTFHPGSFQSGREFLERLRVFLEALKDEKDFQFSVELRNSAWLRSEYFDLLEPLGVSHVFNSWTKMPPLEEQLTVAANHKMPSLVSRVLLQPGTRYAEAVEAFAPYDKVLEPGPALRASVALLIARALELKIPAYIFVNNRAEGCSPRTIEAIVEVLQQRSLI
ncbi:DUF72 domain-containing protein [bacterium]|nr:DUF72 domain-containing protein [bacterium]